MQFYSTCTIIYYIHAGVLTKIASQNDICYFSTYVASYVVCQNSTVCAILIHLLIYAPF